MIVVEHDMRVVAGSDWVIDIGPGAGDEGGRVVAAGPPAEVAALEGEPDGAVPRGDTSQATGWLFHAEPRRRGGRTGFSPRPRVSA